MLTNLKKRSALLLSLAVVCATVAIVPQTAGAAPSIVPNTNVGADVYTAPSAGPDAMDACPGDSASAAGAAFTDVDNNAAVNCIAMFGITTGTTATTYEPNGSIPRWQMALFIHRMFVPTGVAAAGATAVPAFTDTSGLSAEIQAAITALASHGITTGTTATTFGPNDNVTREQMALFLNRFANIAKDHAGAAITAVAAATGNFNYQDITSATYEGMEAIIRLFNLGVTEGTCKAGIQYVLVSTCSSTYRPQDDITRIEMAEMLHRLLSLTNARPAGLWAQSTTSTATLGSETPLVSLRNADFTPRVNVNVDEFYQLHNDATGVAAQAPFNALSGVCSGNVTKTPGATLCVVDAQDKTTDVRGNFEGTAQTTASNKTANWWYHIGDNGTQYVDGTTSDFYKYSLANGAAATAAVHADTTTYTSDGAFATVTDKSGDANVTANDGLNTYAGTSRTYTATMKKAAAATSTVADGYTFKVATKKVDWLGNVTNSTAYYPSSAGVATWTVDCPADDSALTTTYWVHYEQTVTMGAADGGTGIPAGASPANPLASTNYGTGVGGNASKISTYCDDTAKAYTGGTTAEALAISDNTYIISAAGSLGSVTATAYDQYGNGVVGASVTLQSNTDGAGAVTRATLTTGADGTATLSAVVCATGQETVAWSVSDPGANTAQMDAIAATTPNAGAVEGTTMYCANAGTDSSIMDQVTAQQISLLSYTGTKVTGDIDGGTATITVANTDAGTTATTAALDLTVGTVTNVAGAATAIQTAIRGLTNVDNATTVAGAATGGNDVFTITFPANTGNWVVTCTCALTDGGVAVVVTTTNDGSGASQLGKAPRTLDFIDDNPTNNTFVTAFNTTYANAAGAAAAQTVVYQQWTYDDTDFFNSTATQGMTEAQFEAANAAITNLTTNVMVSYRTGALTTGISVFQVN